MPHEIVGSSGNVIAARVSGKLKHSDLRQMQSSAIDLIKRHGRISLFVIADNFQGWEESGDWGDISFQMQYDKNVEKIALTGDQKWEDLVTAFVGKGIRSVDIRYFSPSQIDEAKAWIGWRGDIPPPSKAGRE